VSNEKFALTDFSVSPPTTAMVDFLGLTAEPPLSSLSPHNITGFSVGGYSLVNVRLFWIEGTNMPELVPDLFNNQNLPAVLPSFHGRLALDFVPTGNTNLSYLPASIFFDGLTVTAVPEPETYAMLLAGLGLLGFAARRRKLKEAAVA
jgi:PEP-CTERM motif